MEKKDKVSLYRACHYRGGKQKGGNKYIKSTVRYEKNDINPLPILYLKQFLDGWMN